MIATCSMHCPARKQATPSCSSPSTCKPAVTRVTSCALWHWLNWLKLDTQVMAQQIFPEFPASKMPCPFFWSLGIPNRHSQPEGPQPTSRNLRDVAGAQNNEALQLDASQHGTGFLPQATSSTHQAGGVGETWIFKGLLQQDGHASAAVQPVPQKGHTKKTWNVLSLMQQPATNVNN